MGMLILESLQRPGDDFKPSAPMHEAPEREPAP
jgi:hypothetical protein